MRPLKRSYRKIPGSDSIKHQDSVLMSGCIEVMMTTGKKLLIGWSLGLTAVKNKL